jgi:hypothetical protein
MKAKQKQIILTIGCVLFFIATLTVNFLANAIPINNKSTGELSDAIPNLFVPAGITFAIWGVIYLLLLLFVIYLVSLLFLKEQKYLPFLTNLQGLFIISSVANICWIFAWHYEQIILSFIIMLVLLASLLLLYLQIHKKAHYDTLSWKDKLFISLPFSVYLGWITVATIANATAVLVTYRWDGFGMSGSFWTITMLITATVIGLLMLFLQKDIAFNCVLIWAFVGIIIKRTDPVNIPQTPIVITASVSIGLLVLGGIVLLLLTLVKKKA